MATELEALLAAVHEVTPERRQFRRLSVHPTVVRADPNTAPESGPPSELRFVQNRPWPRLALPHEYARPCGDNPLPADQRYLVNPHKLYRHSNRDFEMSHACHPACRRGSLQNVRTIEPAQRMSPLQTQLGLHPQTETERFVLWQESQAPRRLSAWKL